MTYGWAILVILVAIGTLAYFGVFQNPKDIKFICNNLVVSGDGIDYVYPSLNTTGYDLLANSNVVSVLYDVSKAELKSDKNMLKERGIVFCRVPIDACLTMIQDAGVSICQQWSFTIPVVYNEFLEWFANVKSE